MLKKIFVFSVLMSAPLFAFFDNVECFLVAGQGTDGITYCGVACTDGFFYPMDCDADIFQ